MTTITTEDPQKTAIIGECDIGGQSEDGPSREEMKLLQGEKPKEANRR